MKLSFLYLCGREQSSSFYFFKLKSHGYCTLSTLLDNGNPSPKNAIKSSHLLNRGALSPSSLTAHSYCQQVFWCCRKTAVKDHIGTADSPFQCSCIGPELLHLCPEGMAANWTVEDICGHFHTGPNEHTTEE